MRLLIATTNAGKLKEFREILAADGRDIVGLDELPDPPHVEETGNTFRANACLKAAAYARHYNLWALADDSGLAVDVLGGKPGVHSARWAEMHDRGRGDADNNATLLEQLDAISDPNRAARFMCVLALANPAGSIIATTEGRVDGQILNQPAGDMGFGYDPLFLVPSLGMTTAQLPRERKHEISHRGVAVRAMREVLERLNL